MVFRATQNSWRSMLCRLGGNHHSFATATAPKLKPIAPTMDSIHAAENHHHHSKTMAEYAPVAVVLGLLMVAMTIGGHTAKQQLVHSPGVQVRKKRRETVPEVEDPDHVISSADKFINKSFLRKVAHIQDDHHLILHDPVRPDPFTQPRRAETLKTVGVEPRRRY